MDKNTNRCINYSWSNPGKLCRRKIFDADKYFCDHHIPLNFDEVFKEGCSICGKEELEIGELKVFIG